MGCWRGREREGVETGWAAGVDVGRVLGREGEEVGRSGLDCSWAGFLVLVFLSISLFLILIQT